MRSPTSQADVLQTHIANSAICRRTTNQLNTILDLYEAHHD